MAVRDRAERFFVREDPAYNRYARKFQASSASARLFYLAMHLLPGIFAAVILNIGSVYFPLRDASGLDDRTFQYLLFIAVTFGWHIFLPIGILRLSDGLSWQEIFAFLSLDRVDWKGMFLVLPVIFVPYTLLSLPYFKWVYQPLQDWLYSFPALELPDHSIFKGDLYDFPAIMLLFMLVGNFLGEELYYRGYLMKKCAFLGRHTWWITSLLFAIYHFWQIPHTWPLFLPALIFGLVMILRKNLYVLILLHFLLNIWWVDFVSTLAGQ